MAIDPTEARWFKGQQASARAMLRIYERARLELLGQLTEGAPEGSLTAQHRVAMVAQIEAKISDLQREMGILLLDRTTKQAEDGAKSAAKEIKAVAGGAGVKIEPEVTVALSKLNPATVEHLALRSSTLIKSVGEELRTKIRLELALAQAQGLHAREAAKRIAGTGLTLDGLKKPVFKSVEHRALTIARTETAIAANEQFMQTLKDAQKMGLPVGKRWSATLDSRTSRRCQGLHRKYNQKAIPLDEKFKANDGWEGMGAPAHPNCRSRVATGWLDDSPGSGKIEKMETQQPILGLEQERIKLGVHMGVVTGNIPKARQREILEAAHIAGLTNFLEIHPIGKVNFGSGEKFGPVDMMGAYDPFSRDISIRSHRQKGEYRQPVELGQVPSVSSTGRDEIEAAKISFLHELGHHMHYMASDAVRLLMKEWVGKTKPVSERAKENWKEQFVEAHAAFVFYPEALKVFDENGYKMVVEIRKAMGIDQ